MTLTKPGSKKHKEPSHEKKKKKRKWKLTKTHDCVSQTVRELKNPFLTT